MVEKTLEGGEGHRRDVVLDPLGVELGGLGGHADRALLYVSMRRDVMGAFAIPPLHRVLAVLGAGCVLGLNGVLLADTFGLPIPFLKQVPDAPAGGLLQFVRIGKTSRKH
ncbi:MULTISPECIES: hypothetical protein [Salipiger]|uniref:Manganese transport protein MntH n=1 Tax=Salipiger profundus TaxID=1229727 RepID=A0A1U7D1Q2_9RHOB|nr:Manganese transport protein MntH [Salipiger profundus]SFC40581.1 hypothetical protein SAMN05444415_103187 [Salipiger profundus]